MKQAYQRSLMTNQLGSGLTTSEFDQETLEEQTEF
jgi:hypothetical protein